MGRKKLYRPCRFSVGERQLFEQIRTAILKKFQRQQRIYEQYLTFLSVNNFPDDDESLLKYTVALKYYNNDEGYIVSQLRDIRAEKRRGGRIPFSAIMSHWSLKKTKAGTWRANDHDLESLISHLNEWPRGPERTQLAIMLSTGCRNEDLFGTGTVRISSSRISADIIVSKQRRLADERALLELRGDLVVFGEYSQDLQEDILIWANQRSTHIERTRTRRRETLLGRASTVDVSVLLRFLKRQAFSGTTYTFRRCYIQRIIQRFTSTSGIPDWDAILPYTLHFSPKMVKGVYARMLSQETEL